MAGLGVAVLLSVSACASWQADLKAEQKNGAHFASWQHMGYSLFRGTPKQTTRNDVAAAQREKWWGDAVPMEPIQ
jgi:hypothetical protein